MHELWLVHQNVDVKVLEVQAQESGVWCGDDAVQEHLDGEQVGGGCSNVAVEVDSAAVNGELRSIHLRLLGLLFAHNPVICDLLSLVTGHFLAVDDVYGVGAVVSDWHSLDKAANFFSHGVVLWLFVLWIFNQVSVLEKVASVTVQHRVGKAC